MNLNQCFLTNNDCMKAGKTITPKGIVVHSTGANNKTLKRYVQPDDGKLGTNKNNNSWNRSGITTCVHAFIGTLANGSVAIYQTLPFTMRPWGCGQGNRGSYNNSHIQFEICEDALNDEAYFNSAFKEAIELCAYLCKKYDISVENIVSHHEAYLKGYATNHADCDHWLKKFNKNMDWFRNKVKEQLHAENDQNIAENAQNIKENDQVLSKNDQNIQNDAFVWNFLKAKGLNDIQVAGIMGNIKAESNFDPQNLQNSFEKKLGFNDASYTKAVDDGTYNNFVHDSAGYGLAQWTYHTRKKSLLEYAKINKKSIGDISMQCAFLWLELSQNKAIMNALNSAKTIKEASNVILLNYEKPAKKDDPNVQATRAKNGQFYYDKFAKGDVPASEAPKSDVFTAYKVKIIVDELNVRAGAGIENKVNKKVHKNEVYTIVEEAKGWGKLKSGAGWINVSTKYVKKM